jgi:hypothetical protein
MRNARKYIGSCWNPRNVAAKVNGNNNVITTTAKVATSKYYNTPQKLGA